MDFIKKIQGALNLGIDYADLRIANFNNQTIVSENSNITSIQDNTTYCYSVRAFKDGGWGVAFGTNINNIDNSINKAIKLAKLSSKKVKEKFKLKEFPIYKENVKSNAKINPIEIPFEDKIKKILEYDNCLKKRPVVSRTITASFSNGTNQFYNTDGSEINEARTAFSLYVTVVGKEGNVSQKAFDRINLTSGYERFEQINTEQFCANLYSSLVRLLHAKDAPAGKMPVVIDPILCHVFFHEAVGHACEADAVIEKTSILRDKLGQKIASDCLTLSDNPNIEGANGSYKYDSEGILGKEVFLIKNGILNEFMNSRETASRLNVKENGHGRAELPITMPYPRMSNTVLYPGEYEFEELLEGIKSGIYAKGSAGGVVDPINGNFLFNAQEAFLIENGKITKPLKDVSFGGNILQTLMMVEKIGKDWTLCAVGGMCGKKGQHVPVCGKAPSIKISEAIIGGRTN